jgi:hypothetical protein
VTASKGVNFDRNVRLAWLDETAFLVAAGLGRRELRERLDALLAADLPSKENRRKTAMVLGRIWSWSADKHPARHAEAVSLLDRVAPHERVWLHYGMTLLTHPFFRSVTATIGRLARQRDTVNRNDVRAKLIGEFGELGTIPDAVGRIFYSLADWGAIAKRDGLNEWRPLMDTLRSETLDLELWLLASALEGSPRRELLISDLQRLPELFPFRITAGLEEIRRSPAFAVERQGGGWALVRLSAQNSVSAAR